MIKHLPPKVCNRTFQELFEEVKQVEQALERTTSELQGYFDMSLDLLCIADTGGRFQRLNPQWAEVLGDSTGELEGAYFLDFVHPDDLQNTLDTMGKLRDQQDVMNFENRYRSKDGS